MNYFSLILIYLNSFLKMMNFILKSLSEIKLHSTIKNIFALKDNILSKLPRFLNILISTKWVFFH